MKIEKLLCIQHYHKTAFGTYSLTTFEEQKEIEREKERQKKKKTLETK